MSEPTNTAERTEEVVAQVMRATRDEKLRLDTLLAEKEKTIANLLVERDEFAIVHERYIKRATQLETDLRAMIAVLNDALNTKPIFSRKSLAEPVRDEPVGGETLGEEPASDMRGSELAALYPHRVNRRQYD